MSSRRHPRKTQITVETEEFSRLGLSPSGVNGVIGTLNEVDGVVMYLLT